MRWVLSGAVLQHRILDTQSILSKRLAWAGSVPMLDVLDTKSISKAARSSKCYGLILKVSFGLGGAGTPF
jgi:hypothetical protein